MLVLAPHCGTFVRGVQGIKQAPKTFLYFICHLPNEPILALNSEFAELFFFSILLSILFVIC